MGGPGDRRSGSTRGLAAIQSVSRRHARARRRADDRDAGPDGPAACRRWRTRIADETVAIVSHGDPLRSVVAFYLGISIDMMLRFEISPASVSVLELSEWTSRVMCVNDRGGELGL